MSVVQEQDSHLHDGHGHDGHGHSHSHPHVDAVTEGMQHHGPSYEGTAVLDIGGTMGAVVLYVGADLAGLEIDLPGLGEGTWSTHSLVRERRVAGSVMYAAVYPQLPEGRYRIDDLAGRTGREVVVRGGEVTEIDWSEPDVG